MTGSLHNVKAGSTILIIEDDIAFAELTSATLKEHGFKAIGATSGLEAMELLTGRMKKSKTNAEFLMAMNLS